jgi:ligand-binding sensor protein
MNDVELEKKFELTELIDLGLLGDVIRALAEMVGIQVRIFDMEGKEIFDSGGEKGFCGLLRGTLTGERVCQEVREKLLGQFLSEGSALQIQAACGNKYTVFPVRHQFENLGRVILGPYQDSVLDSQKLDAIAAKFRMDPVKFVQAYKEMPEVSPERLKKMARFMARFFDAFVFINAKRLITSLMHLELIMQSRDRIFQEMEKEKANPADKKEIEKLKSMF